MVNTVYTYKGLWCASSCEDSVSGHLSSGPLKQRLFTDVHMDSRSDAESGSALSNDYSFISLLQLLHYRTPECLPQLLLDLQAQLEAVGTAMTSWARPQSSSAPDRPQCCSR